MCAINPKHTLTFELKAYTSHDISEEEFKVGVMENVLLMEQALNKDGRFRFHVSAREEAEAEAEANTLNLTPAEETSFDDLISNIMTTHNCTEQTALKALLQVIQPVITETTTTTD